MKDLKENLCGRRRTKRGEKHKIQEGRGARENALLMKCNSEAVGRSGRERLELLNLCVLETLDSINFKDHWSRKYLRFENSRP